MALATNLPGMPETNRESVLAKCLYFSDTALWPDLTVINPEGWLANFGTSQDEDYAVHLLNAFVYFNSRLIDQTLVESLHSLAPTIHAREPSGSLRGAWRKFTAEVMVTYVTGEVPHVADSGFAFARRARQVLGFAESQIRPPERVLELLAKGTDAPVIFVDDFVGTGQQFIATWNRAYVLPSGAATSFRVAAANSVGPFIYMPIVATHHGASAIRRNCPDVLMWPGHELGDAYNLTHTSSRMWPTRLRSSASIWLRDKSLALGIQDTAGGDTRDWAGYNRLGLAIALGDSVPDATLPIFYWEQGGWTPLIRKR